ncbi:MAG TPA: hypothetical protein VF503_15135 [Sphingobium sp.]|uniref:hypothetical protein n=1 Tax=Sphingobium sp. TaxID=1912891 RepID=UPI002ED02AF9
MATPFHEQRNRISKPNPAEAETSETQQTENSQRNSDPDSEPEKPATSKHRPTSETWNDRGSASQNTEKARCNALPLQSGGASPSLKVRAMVWHNIAEILFGLAAVITALKQGGKKK